VYEDFYGLSEGPFDLGRDPRSLYLTPSHAEALSGMLSGVRERKGITVITGEVGTGKTTLIHALFSDLDETVRKAFICYTYLEFRDLLKSILIELGIPAKGRDTSALLKKFYLYLSERPQDEIVAIIIDEAQGLETTALKGLMGLWAGSDPRYQLLQTVLVGQPELEAKLDSQELREFRDGIAVRCHIRPMSRKESNAYIDHRLRIAGSFSSRVFKPEAVDRICDYAGGIPRVINMVCDGSLLIGYAKSKRQIDVKIVNEAIADLSLFEPKEAKRTLPERPVYQLLEWVRSLKPAVPPADGREERAPVLTAESVPEPLTLESSPEPLQAEGSGREEPVPEPVAVPQLRWRPVYQLLEWVRSLKPAVHPADGREEPVPEPVAVPQLRWRPVYQTLTGALLGMVALGLFNLFIWHRAPREGMTVKGTRTVIAEKGSTLSVQAEQSQGLVPVPSASVKRARPQRLVRHQGARPQGQRLTYKQGEPPQRLAYDAGKSPLPLAHREGEPPQRLAPYRLNDAERNALLLKEDAAWRVLQR
jgi:general secretion pathway protein A